MKHPLIIFGLTLIIIGFSFWSYGQAKVNEYHAPANSFAEYLFKWGDPDNPPGLAEKSLGQGIFLVGILMASAGYFLKKEKRKKP